MRGLRPWGTWPATPIFAAPGGPPVSDTVRIALIAIVAVAAARLIVPRVPVVGPQLAAFV